MASQTRLSFQVIAETCITFGFGIWMFHYINRWWGLFLILILISLFYPAYTRYSFLTWFAVFIMCVWYSLLVITLKEKHIVHFLNAMCVIVLFHTLFQVAQSLNGIVFKTYVIGTVPTGLMANQNEVAALYAFCMPAFFRKKFLIGIPMILGGLILSRTSLGMVSAIVGAWVYLLIISPKIAYLSVIPGLALCVLYLVFVDMPTFMRFDVWKYALGMHKEHWIFGSGIGHWKLLFTKLAQNGKFREIWYTAHNEYIQGIFEMGILFVPICFGYIITTIQRAWKQRKIMAIPLAAFAVILFNSAGHFSMHIATTALIAVTWMAIIEVQLNVLDSNNYSFSRRHCSCDNT